MRPHERWQIDPEGSTLRFGIRHAVLGNLTGQFHCWGGFVQCASDPRESTIHIWVDLSSIDTGSQERDQYILGTDLFDLNVEPALVFDSDQIEVGDVHHAQIKGRVTLHSYRHEILLAVETDLAHGFPPPAERLGYWATGSIDRHTLGLSRPLRIRDCLGEHLLGKSIEVTAHLEMARVASPAPEPEVPKVAPQVLELNSSRAAASAEILLSDSSRRVTLVLGSSGHPDLTRSGFLGPQNHDASR